MRYVVFGCGGWEELPCKRLLDIVPERECMRLICAGEEDRGLQGSGVEPLGLARLGELPAAEYTAIVASPYWLQTVLAWKPGRIVCWLERLPEGGNAALWEKLGGLLAARADLVVTPSEKVYLEQSLRRGGVFLFAGDDPRSFDAAEDLRGGLIFLRDYELFVREALGAMLRGGAAAAWQRRQRESRMRYFRSLDKRISGHEMITYMLASYLYLLDKPEAAEPLAVSFEQMALRGADGCLNSHFRFFSAIEAKQDELDKAVHTYAITAFSEPERKSLKALKRWLAEGREALVKAELFRVNEDYCSGIRTLEEAAERSDEAARLLLHCFSQTFRWEEALPLLEKLPLSREEEIKRAAVLGAVHAMYGRKHAAAGALLRAVMQDWNALAHFGEWKDMEHATSVITGRMNDA